MLAYVFIPRANASSDVSGSADSDKGQLEFSVEKLDKNTSVLETNRRRHEVNRGQLKRRRHKSRKEQRRRSRGIKDKIRGGDSIPTHPNLPLEFVLTDEEDNTNETDTQSYTPVTQAEIPDQAQDSENGDVKKQRHLVENRFTDALDTEEESDPVETKSDKSSRQMNKEPAIIESVHTDIDNTEGIIQEQTDNQTLAAEMPDEVFENNRTSETESDTNLPTQMNANNGTVVTNEESNNTMSFIPNEHQTFTSPTVCPKCGTKEQQKRFHVDLFKQTLLQKLGMKSAPKTEGPLPPLPFDFYLGEDFSVSDEPEEEAEERRAVKTREVFIFGTDVTHRCHNKKGAGCYSFNLTDKGLDPDEVGSIELWIYKQQDLNDHHIQTFMVSELDKSSKKINGEHMLRHKNIAKRIETRLKHGWMKIYVRRTVLRWLSKPHRNQGLAVVCKTCKRTNHKTIYGYKEGMMPILVFYMRQTSSHRRRYRRDTDCIEGGNNCCHKETLEINFQDIGWDYIMAPTSIRPNFCTGSCNGIQAAYYNHTRLVQTLQQSVLHNYGSQLQPCCSPVSFRQPQSLIYRDHQGVVRKIDIPDLIVGDCGCT